MELTIFQNCLRQQLHAHRTMQPQDVVKLCYQAACGAEHLLRDLSGAKQFFREEYASVSVTDEPLAEQISSEVCRVNLGAWKRTGMPCDWLFRMFADTVFQTDGKHSLPKYLAAAEAVLREERFDMDAWRLFLEDYRNDGMPAVRHSAVYREHEHPAYRIVSATYLQALKGGEDALRELFRV